MSLSLLPPLAYWGTNCHKRCSSERLEINSWLIHNLNNGPLGILVERERRLLCTLPKAEDTKEWPTVHPQVLPDLNAHQQQEIFLLGRFGNFETVGFGYPQT